MKKLLLYILILVLLTGCSNITDESTIETFETTILETTIEQSSSTEDYSNIDPSASLPIDITIEESTISTLPIITEPVEVMTTPEETEYNLTELKPDPDYANVAGAEVLKEMVRNDITEIIFDETDFPLVLEYTGKALEIKNKQFFDSPIPKTAYYYALAGIPNIFRGYIKYLPENAYISTDDGKANQLGEYDFNFYIIIDNDYENMTVQTIPIIFVDTHTPVVSVSQMPKNLNERNLHYIIEVIDEIIGPYSPISKPDDTNSVDIHSWYIDEIIQNSELDYTVKIVFHDLTGTYTEDVSITLDLENGFDYIGD